MKRLAVLALLLLLPTTALALTAEYIPIGYQPGYREGGVYGGVDTVRAFFLSTSFGVFFLDFTAGPLLFMDEDSAEWAGGGTYIEYTPTHHIVTEGLVEGVALQLGPRWPYIQPETQQPHPLGGSWPATMVLDLDRDLTMTIHLDSLDGSIRGFAASASRIEVAHDAVAPVPEPGTLLLLASGFAAMGGLGMWWGRETP